MRSAERVGSFFRDIEAIAAGRGMSFSEKRVLHRLLFAGAFWMPLVIGGVVVACLPWLWWNGGILEMDIPRHFMAPRSNSSVSVRVNSLLRQSVAGWEYPKGGEPSSFFFRLDSTADSALELYEDGAWLGPGGADGKEVLDLGGGRFAYRGGDLLFSSSDRRSPRQGKRTYSVRKLTRPKIGALELGVGIVSWIFLISLLVHTALGWRKHWDYLVGDFAARSSFSILVVLFLYSTYVFCFSSLERKFSLAVYFFLATLCGLWLVRNIRRFTCEKWMLWPVVFFVYAVARGAVIEAPYASCSAGQDLMVTSLLGVVVFSMLSLEIPASRGRVFVFSAVFFLLSFLFVIQDFGFEVRSFLWRFGDSAFFPWRSDVWHRKFQETWYLVLGWCAVAVRVDEHQRRRFLIAVYLAIASGVVFLGYSLSAKVAMVVGLAILPISYFFPRFAWRGVLLAFILSFLIAPVAARAIWDYSVRSRSFASSSLELHLTERIVTWRYASMLIAKHPWLGWGLGASGNLPGSMRSETAELLLTEAPVIPKELAGLRALPGGHPHSLPLLIWLDLGAVGIGLAIMVLVTIFREIRRVDDRLRRSVVLALVTSILVIFEFSYPVWQPTLQLFLLVTAIAVCSAGRRSAEKRNIEVAPTAASLEAGGFGVDAVREEHCDR